MKEEDKCFYLAIIVLAISIFVGSNICYLALQEGLPLWLSVVTSIFVGFLSLFCGMFAISE